MSSKQSSPRPDALERVMDLVRDLRDRCPWDAAQTPRSLIPYLLEEAHETADAITQGDDGAVRDELGDLLLNVAFQLVIAQEEERFTANQVADAVIDKMQRRHPHLFGLGEKEDWETLKARERRRGSAEADGDGGPDGDAGVEGGLLHGMTRDFDALSRAHRIQDRVASVGFDWEDATGAFAKVAEELEEVREQLAATRLADRVGRVGRGRGDASEALEEELGDLLFAVVNLARLAGSHALTALHGANAKFTRRFEALERLAREREIELETADLDALEELWQAVKAEEG